MKAEGRRLAVDIDMQAFKNKSHISIHPPVAQGECSELA
jgi:hypothetical protein